MHPLELFGFCPKCGSSRFAVNSEKSRKCDNCGFEFFMNPAASVVEPAKGTLDLPGGFADAQETAEESVAREVMEETSLEVTSARYLFSMPNVYRYSGMDINTLDLFFECGVKDTAALKAGDDAAECLWVPLEDIRTELFGLRSVRHGLKEYMNRKENAKT